MFAWSLYMNAAERRRGKTAVAQKRSATILIAERFFRGGRFLKKVKTYLVNIFLTITQEA